jgi:hypothetical protein
MSAFGCRRDGGECGPTQARRLCGEEGRYRVQDRHHGVQDWRGRNVRRNEARRLCGGYGELRGVHAASFDRVRKGGNNAVLQSKFQGHLGAPCHFVTRSD